MKTVISFLAISSLLIFTSCKKVEGPGGSSTIKGSVIVEVYDLFDNYIGEYLAADEDVFIIYGDNPDDTYFDDDIKTSYDGSFEFRYLEQGEYRIFVYTDDASVFGSGETVVMQTVTIDSKKQTVEMDPFRIRK